MDLQLNTFPAHSIAGDTPGFGPFTSPWVPSALLPVKHKHHEESMTGRSQSALSPR